MGDLIPLAHAAATGCMTGLIWFVQVVHYPLLARVGAASFVEYEQAHMRRTTWVVTPFMVLEALTAIVLPFVILTQPGRALAWVGLALLAVVWMSTALLQVPCHRRLARGFDQGTLRRLVATNWIRTVCWSLRLAVALALLIGTGIACSPGVPDRSRSLTAELEARIPDVVAQGNSPSMQVAVVHGNRLIWSRAFGEDQRIDSVYMNGSVQKSFDAAAVLQLAERGLIDLDADVANYLPFPLRHPDHPDEPVTTRMLLDHRAGLGAANHQFAWDTGSVFSPVYRPPCPPYLLEMSLEQFMAASLTPEGPNYSAGIWVARPGAGYRYSLVAFALLRSMVERVTGQSYADYMRQNLFEPLGMTGSGYSAEPFGEFREGDFEPAMGVEVVQ